MLKDDRMMGMLTFVVIMLALGTVVQRVDVVGLLFGTTAETGAEAQGNAQDSTMALRADKAEVEAGGTVEVDVLANDTGVADGKPVLAAHPDCGRAYVRNGMVRYLGNARCEGDQVIRYRVGEGEETAELHIKVRPKAPSEAQAWRERVAASSAGQGGDDDALPRAGGGERQTSAAVPGATDRAGADDAGGGSATRTAVAAPSADLGAATVAGQRGECTTPPTLTLGVGAGAVTEVGVDAPCAAGTVAELAYDGLRFAVPLDARGSGSVAVPGLQRSTEASLTLEGGEPMAFNLPFEDTGRIDRVAIAWTTPEALALNAFEFGARPGGGGHVTPATPRSLEAVRREGGGWLNSYEPVEGKGQHIDVYSFWRRHSGPSGVVKLALDPGGGAGAGDCGTDAARDYVVLRSMGGELERARLGRIAPLDCTKLAGTGRYMGHAVDDLIVRSR